MPEGLGNLFSGLAEGFGHSFSEYRKQKFEKEQADHQMRFSLVGKLLSDPSTTPEMIQMVHKDLFGKNLKDKDEKKAVEKLLTMASQARIPSSEAQQSQGHIDQSQAKGVNQEQLQQESRPRLSMTAKPRYSLEDLRNQRAADTSSEVNAQQNAIAPFKKEEEGRKYRHQMEVETLRGQNRTENEKLKEDAKANLDVNKHTAALKAEWQMNNPEQEITPEIEAQLKGKAGQEINELGKAKLGELQQRAENVKQKHEIDKKRLALYAKNVESMISSRSIAAGQRQQSLAIQQKALGLRSDIAQMQALEKQIDKDYTEFDTQARIKSSTKYADAANDAQNRMKAIEQEISGYRDKLDKMGAELDSSSSSSANPVSSSPPSKKLTKQGGTSNSKSPQVGSIVMANGKKIRIKKIEGGKITDYDEVP